MCNVVIDRVLAETKKAVRRPLRSSTGGPQTTPGKGCVLCLKNTLCPALSPTTCTLRPFCCVKAVSGAASCITIVVACRSCSRANACRNSGTSTRAAQ